MIFESCCGVNFLALTFPPQSPHTNDRRLQSTEHKATLDPNDENFQQVTLVVSRYNCNTFARLLACHVKGGGSSLGSSGLTARRS